MFIYMFCKDSFSRKYGLVVKQNFYTQLDSRNGNHKINKGQLQLDLRLGKWRIMARIIDSSLLL